MYVGTCIKCEMFCNLTTPFLSSHELDSKCEIQLKIIWHLFEVNTCWIRYEIYKTYLKLNPDVAACSDEVLNKCLDYFTIWTENCFGEQLEIPSTGNEYVPVCVMGLESSTKMFIIFAELCLLMDFSKCLCGVTKLKSFKITSFLL